MPTIDTTSEDTRIYELCVLYPFPVTQKEEQEILKEVEAIVTEAGGQQVAVDKWGRRGLAYKIGGYEEGNYIIYHYEIDPSKIDEIDNALRITKGILRHMIVKPPKGYEIEKYSEKYEEWLKTRADEEVNKEKEREEAIAKKVAERAKRQVKKAETEKKEVEKAAPKTVKKEELQEELEKLISDDDLDL